MPDQVNLLQLLGSGVRPVHSAPVASPPGVEHTSFADLLQQARAGTLRSERSVSVDLGVDVDLNAEQLAKLSLAADQAEAAGVRTAVVLLDDGAAILDVASRRITGRADLSGGVLSGVDGVVNLKSDPASVPSLGPPGASLPAGSSLARLLDDAHRRRAG